MVMQVQPLWYTGEHAVRTPYGVVLPPGGRVAAFVRSTGPQNYDPPEVVENMTSSVANALTRCRASMGDTIVCLPGHTESSPSATWMSAIVAGTRIVGLGHGSLRPTFTWAHTAAQWAVAVANVHLENIILKPNGANGVVKAINVTGADFSMVGCDVEVATNTNLHCEIALELGTASHRAKIFGNRFYGIVGEPITDGILNAGVAHDIQIIGNEMIFASTTGTTASLIRVGAVASLRMSIGKNRLFNTVAASDNCIVTGAAASQGVIWDNYITVLTNDVPVTNGNGISIGAGGLFGMFNNRVTTNVNVSGELAPVVDA